MVCLYIYLIHTKNESQCKWALNTSMMITVLLLANFSGKLFDALFYPRSHRDFHLKEE